MECLESHATDEQLVDRTVRGFTLIELLVVISIITLLIALLLPALKQARETGIAVQCSSQIRQVMLGTLMYTDAHKGKFPVSVWTGYASPPFRAYGDAVAQGGYCPPKMFYCPSNAKALAVFNGLTDPLSSGTWWTYTSYGASRRGVMPSIADLTAVLPSDRRVTPTLSLLGGTASRIIGIAEATTTANIYEASAELSTDTNGSRKLAPRHLESANAAYVDGHVVRHNPADLGFNVATNAWDQTATWYANAPWFRNVFIMP